MSESRTFKSWEGETLVIYSTAEDGTLPQFVVFNVDRQRIESGPYNSLEEARRAAAVERMYIPVISTSHITEDVSRRLARDGDDNPWALCAPYAEGMFLYLGELDDSAPQCLHDVRAWAGREGWVRLDSCAPKVEELPTYEW